MPEEQVLAPPAGETVLTGGSDEIKATEEKGGSDEIKATEEQATEEKTAEEKAAEEKAAEEKGEEDDGAPEAYADFATPEGVEVDDEVLGEFHTLAKEFNLSQERAQKLIDLQAKFIGKTVESIQEQNLKVWAKMREDWLTDSKKDKGIGGQEFTASVDLAKRALSKFGTPELVELFETYGFGNHPEIIRVMSRVGAELGEDTITSGGGSDAAKSLADRIYTNS